jgi:hypothetical protein
MLFFFQGAELDILPTVTSWRNVSHLVFEYSFTKRRDMAFFWDVISQLRGHGFDSIAFKDYTGLCYLLNDLCNKAYTATQV